MYFKNLATKWKVVALIAIAIVIAVGVVCAIAGIKSATDDISFLDALGQMFGGAKEIAEEVVPDSSQDVVPAACLI